MTPVRWRGRGGWQCAGMRATETIIEQVPGGIGCDGDGGTGCIEGFGGLR